MVRLKLNLLSYLIKIKLIKYFNNLIYVKYLAHNLFKMEVFGKIDYSKNFISVSPNERNILIQNINNTPNYEYVQTSRPTTNFWKTKHNPDEQIPTRIYLLGNGTTDELFQKYNNKYGENTINIKEFKNFIREMIYQKLLI